MCHENFVHEFGPRINFITGRNGSGKSTILTAITMCLGGRASATDRGSNVATLVKEGKQKARIRVTLVNEGARAYQPEVFGNKITVERMITRSDQGGRIKGTTSYRIMNSAGKHVTSTKEDLQSIIDWFHFQIDNPFAILTQDMARRFLTETKPKVKYDLLMEGLRFVQMERMREQSESKLAYVQQRVEEQREALKGPRQEYENAQREIRKFKKVREYEAALDKIRAKIAWQAIGRCENEIELRDIQIKELQDLIDRINDDTNNHDAIVAKARKVVSDIDDQILEHTAEADRLKERKLVHDSKLSEAQRKLKKCDEDGKQINSEKIKYEEQRKSLEQELVELESRAPEKQQVHSQLEEMRAASEDIQRKIDSAMSKDEQMARTLSQLEDPAEVRSIKEKVDGAVHDRNDCNDRIRGLRARLERESGQEGTFDPSAFDRNLGRVLQEIERDNRFTVKPIGPLGRYITLKKPEWRMLLESHLNSVLSSFWVQTSADRNRLKAILDRCNASSFPIVLRNPEIYDFPRLSDQTSILDVLDFRHPDDTVNENIKRLLVDMRSVEKVALIPKREDASRIVAQNRQIRFAITFADRPGPKFGALGHRVDAQSTRRLEGKDTYRMGMDNQTKIRELRESLSLEQDRLGNLEHKVQELKRVQSERRNQVESLRSDRARMRSDLSRLRMQLQGFEEKSDALAATVDDSVINDKRDRIQSGISTCKSEIDRQMNLFVDLRAHRSEIKEELKRLSRETAELDAERAELGKRRKKLDDEHMAAKERLRKLDDSARSRVTTIARHQDKLKTLETDKTQFEEKLVQLREKAERWPERIEVNLEEDLVREQQKALDFIKEYREKHRLESEEEAKARFLELGRKYKEELGILSNLETALQHTKRTSDDHRQVSKEVERITIRDIENFFKENLRQRAFEGDLRIDKVNEKISMRISPANKTGDLRDVATLSGGEKSFSQIALLVALWRSMQCSLLALDEL